MRLLQIFTIDFFKNMVLILKENQMQAETIISSEYNKNIEKPEAISPERLRKKNRLAYVHPYRS